MRFAEVVVSATLALTVVLPSFQAAAQQGAVDHPIAFIESAREDLIRSLQAQQQVALIRERRLADDREQKLLAQAETRMRELRAQLDRAGPTQQGASAAQEDLRRQLAVARADFAKLTGEVAARDSQVQAQLASYRAEVAALVGRASEAKLAALQRFADGDRDGAWPVLKDLTAAARRARDAASAADQRELARLGKIRWQNGEMTAAALLKEWDDAVQLDPRDVWTHIERGRLLVELGDSESAATAFAEARKNATNPYDQAAALMDEAEVLVAQNDLNGARQRFEQSLQIAQRLAAQDPSSARLQRDISVSLNKVGDVLVAQNDLNGARQRFEQSLQIRQRLAEQDPSSASLQRDVSVSLIKVGDVLVAQNDLNGARQRFEQSLQILQRLAERDPSSASRQRDVSVSLNKVGDVLVAQNDLNGARQRFEQSLQIAQRLAAQDRSSASLQRDVSVSLDRVGDMLVAQNDLNGARQRFEQSLQIRQRLAEQDRSSASLQRDISVSLNNVGDVLVAQNDLNGARQRFEQSLQIAQRLAEQDRSSASLQRDLAVSLWRVARTDSRKATWALVLEQLERMKTKGMLRPADAHFIERARQEWASAP